MADEAKSLYDALGDRLKGNKPHRRVVERKPIRKVSGLSFSEELRELQSNALYSNIHHLKSLIVNLWFWWLPLLVFGLWKWIEYCLGLLEERFEVFRSWPLGVALVDFFVGLLGAFRDAFLFMLGISNLPDGPKWSDLTPFIFLGIVILYVFGTIRAVYAWRNQHIIVTEEVTALFDKGSWWLMLRERRQRLSNQIMKGSQLKRSWLDIILFWGCGSFIFAKEDLAGDWDGSPVRNVRKYSLLLAAVSRVVESNKINQQNAVRLAVQAVSAEAIQELMRNQRSSEPTKPASSAEE